MGNKVKYDGYGSTYHLNGVCYGKTQCLQVYYKHCDDYTVKEDKTIHLKTAKEIFNICQKIHMENS